MAMAAISTPAIGRDLEWSALSTAIKQTVHGWLPPDAVEFAFQGYEEPRLHPVAGRLGERGRTAMNAGRGFPLMSRLGRFVYECAPLLKTDHAMTRTAMSRVMLRGIAA